MPQSRVRAALCRLVFAVVTALMVWPADAAGTADRARAGAATALPGDFVYLRDVDPSILQDIRYASANNFTGRRLAGYEAGECVVKRDVALALSRVQANL